MAAYISVSHPRKFHPFCHSYYSYDPLFPSPKPNRVALNYLPASSNFSKTHSPISANSFNFASSANCRRLLPATIHASSEKSSEVSPQINSPSSKAMRRNPQQKLLHHFSLRIILEIITFIWRLPGFIAGFLKKEDKFLDTIEEDIIETANAVKIGAKVVEEVAEGLEDIAEGLEKASKVLDKDAKKVDAIMDEVKEKTKTAHDELEEVVGSLQGSVQDMEKDVAKVQVKVKESKEKINNAPMTTKDPPPPLATTTEPPPPLATTTNSRTKNANTSEYKTFQDSILIWRKQNLLHLFLDSLKWPLVHVNSESLSSYLMSLPRLFFGTMIMVSFIFVLGGMTNTPLVSYAF